MMWEPRDFKVYRKRKAFEMKAVEDEAFVTLMKKISISTFVAGVIAFSSAIVRVSPYIF